MRTYLLLAVAFWLFCAASAPARNIFVNNLTGDDRRGGEQPVSQGEAGGPCRSIAKALRIAQASDRIIVANTGEPYRESLSVQGARHSGSDAFPFVIEGNGALLDGTINLSEADWEHVAGNYFRTQPRLMSYQQVFLSGQPAVRKLPALGRVPKLEPTEWCLLEGWIYFRVEDGKLPQSYDLACSGETVGVTLYDVHDVIVRDLAVIGFQLDGVNCHDNVRRSDLVGIQSDWNGRSGISVGGSCRVRIDTCSAEGNFEAQVRTEGYCVVEMLDNRLNETTAPAVIREGGMIVGQPNE
jgi:hypothetical protein